MRLKAKNVQEKTKNEKIFCISVSHLSNKIGGAIYPNKNHIYRKSGIKNSFAFA